MTKRDAHTPEFIDLVRRHTGKMSLPEFLDRIPFPETYDPFAAFDNPAEADRILIPFWWGCFKAELLEIGACAGKGLAYVELSRIWRGEPLEDGDEARANGYLYLNANMYLTNWGTATLAFFDHVLYFLHDDHRHSLGREHDGDGFVLSRNIEREILEVAEGRRPSHLYGKEELPMLRAILDSRRQLLGTRLADLRSFRNRRIHRYFTLLGGNRFPFAMHPGRSGGPVVSGPGDPSPLTVERIEELVPELWQVKIEMLRQLWAVPSLRPRL